MRTLVLARVPQKTREYNHVSGRAISDRPVIVGETVISVDLDELLGLLEGKTDEEKGRLLKDMGYEEYFDELREEEGFEWL